MLRATAMLLGAARFPLQHLATTGTSERITARTALDEQAQFTQCMKDWDAKTHMTKQEWERTCRRVTDEPV